MDTACGYCHRCIINSNLFKMTEKEISKMRPMLGRAIWSYDNNVIIIKDWTTDDSVYIKNESGDMFNEVAMYLNKLGISIDAYSVLKGNELLIFTKNFDIKLQMDNFGV